jgi:hypothetical protein
MQFYQAVCPNCGRIPEARDKQHWKSQPHQSRGLAEIQAGTHDRIKHDGADTASVREFDAEPIGSLPREEPEVSA